MKLFFIKLFVRSADDVIGWLDTLEQRLRNLAEQASLEADKLERDTAATVAIIRENAAKARAVADRVKG